MNLINETARRYISRSEDLGARRMPPVAPAPGGIGSEARVSAMGADRCRRMRILVCARQLPHNSEGFRVANRLGRSDCEVTLSENGAVDCDACDAVLLLGNAAWYPAMVKQLRTAGAGPRPFVTVWHWEPLPPPG